MADILIKGLEMPKKGNIALLLYSDGSVEICGTGSLSKPLYGVPVEKAVALPEHGRLIDADELEKAAEKMVICDSYEHTIAHEMTKGLLKIAPSVLEANNE